MQSFRTELSDDHAHGDPHTANTHLAAHHVRLLGNAIELPHGILHHSRRLAGSRIQ